MRNDNGLGPISGENRDRDTSFSLYAIENVHAAQGNEETRPIFFELASDILQAGDDV